MKDFCGEWQYKGTRFILHEDGTLEVYNLDTIFVYWDNPQLSKYYKDIWRIEHFGKWDNRINLGLDTHHGTIFFIESDDELIYYIGDPDDWNRAVIRKVKP